MKMHKKHDAYIILFYNNIFLPPKFKTSSNSVIKYFIPRSGEQTKAVSRQYHFGTFKEVVTS